MIQTIFQLPPSLWDANISQMFLISGATSVCFPSISHYKVKYGSQKALDLGPVYCARSGVSVKLAHRTLNLQSSAQRPGRVMPLGYFQAPVFLLDFPVNVNQN